MAVSASNAPHTQKYCPLLSSCAAVACIIQALSIGSLRNLRRHQVHQWEDEHPHQVNEVPIQPRNFDILRVIVLRLQKQNDYRYQERETQHVNSVVKNIVRGNQKISCDPKHSQDRQKPFAECDYSQVDHANCDMEHVHRSKPEERG